MPPTVPLEQALAQAREIKALTAEVANLNRLRVRLSEDSQMHLDRAKIAEADVKALAEALEPFASGGDWGAWKSYIVHGPQTKDMGIVAAKQITAWQIAVDAVLGRDGVRRGREEEKPYSAP